MHSYMQLVHKECQRQWGRVLGASSGYVQVLEVPQVASAQPLQQFLKNRPGLTVYVGNILLRYYSNTESLEMSKQEEKLLT